MPTDQDRKQAEELILFIMDHCQKENISPKICYLAACAMVGGFEYFTAKKIQENPMFMMQGGNA